jgi:uroporphyrin-III C-methyltransferase/precorrin-2 dehydrogenase/sirohydrochlorin ferrochelatase
MIRAARRGQRVVRLKGGDPYVFGRGGEEALALRAANVPFDVVPGLTSAVAAPALAGIPVTHRGVTSAFTVLAGHAPESYTAVLDAIAPGALTLVFLMAVAQQREIAAALRARGWRPSTPAALIFSASRPESETWVGTIAALEAGDGVVDAERPGMLVVGEVVRLRDEICRVKDDLQMTASLAAGAEMVEAAR